MTFRKIKRLYSKKFYLNITATFILMDASLGHVREKRKKNKQKTKKTNKLLINNYEMSHELLLSKKTKESGVENEITRKLLDPVYLQKQQKEHSSSFEKNESFLSTYPNSHFTKNKRHLWKI